jgi:hypothetical protein
MEEIRHVRSYFYIRISCQFSKQYLIINNLHNLLAEMLNICNIFTGSYKINNSATVLHYTAKKQMMLTGIQRLEDFSS